MGRNDPCPCGSGKKYKKCCLRLDREAGIPASQAGVSHFGPRMGEDGTLLEALPRWARDQREVFEEAQEGDLLPPVTWRDETTGVEISWPLDAWYEDGA